ncbi:hypothetical protein GW17_00039635 [Ensete ventricosum]|nr:hypothetical protein GW17_00039635 [Ensete ventricosum]
MNTVIRELVVGPWELYGVRHIFDVSLDPKIVHGWHRMGDGTALAMSRAGSSMPSKRTTAVEIGAANVEAESAVNGVGLVKLMGRSTEHIALHAMLSNRDMECYLILETDFLEGKKDESGNPVFLDVGTWLKSELNKWWKEEHAGQLFTVKYIDPMYMIRAVSANATDNLCCTILVHSAIHGFVAGPIDGNYGYIPAEAVPRNVVDTRFCEEAKCYEL